MTQASGDPRVVRVRSQPNIYTVLIFVAIVALAVTILMVVTKLLAATPSGYGLSIGDLFKPFEAPR